MQKLKPKKLNNSIIRFKIILSLVSGISFAIIGIISVSIWVGSLLHIRVFNPVSVYVASLVITHSPQSWPVAGIIVSSSVISFWRSSSL